MATTEMTPGALAEVSASVPAGQPVFMVNLLRYKQQADHGDRADLPPCSGHEAYFTR